MRCPNCDKTISRNDKFCRYCGKLITAPPPPAPFQRAASGIKIPIEDNDFGSAEILASHSGATWGAHIYTGHSQGSDEIKARPEGCPEWVEKNDWPCWFRRGLAVWDHGSQRIGTILAGEAIELLKKLESSDEWTTQGIAIVERHTNWLSLDEAPRSKRSRKKKDVEPESPPEAPKPESKFYEQERVRLIGGAAEEFPAYLRDNEAQLRHMAEEEESLQQKADRRISELMVQILNNHELDDFSAAGRKFPWVRQEYPRALVCDVPPDRGTITLSEDGFWWQPVVERPGHMKYDYERFLMLEEALTWVEQKIPELRAQDEEFEKNWEREQAEEEAKITELPNKDLTPYWIDPADLEPERITYRAAIEVEYVPYSSKTQEISFGQKRHYDQEYYTPLSS